MPAKLFIGDIVLYAKRSLTIPIELPILPYAFNGGLLIDKEYTLVLELSDAENKAIVYENSFEMPRFKVIYDPEYLPHTIIKSLKITDSEDNEVYTGGPDIPELDINEVYDFNYEYYTVAKDLAPGKFDIACDIDGISAGSNIEELTTGETSFTALLMFYNQTLGEHHVNISHSDFLTPANFITPQPESLSHFKVKFVDAKAGIDDILTDGPNKEVGRYNLQGIRVPADTKGFVIIYYSDGSRRKVFVK